MAKWYTLPTKMTTLSGSMKSNILAFAFLLVSIAPSIASAAVTDFIPLVGIPGIADSDLATTGFGDYINALYRLSISIAALLAVIKIVAAGAKYMLSDIVTHKEDAKKDIQGALLGLLVIIGAVIILTTINTDITKNTIAIDKLTNLDGTNNLDSDIQNLLNRIRSKEQMLCDNADTAIGERCASEFRNTDFQDDCLARKGIYTPGSVLGYAIGVSDFENKCTYLVTPDNGDTVAIPLTGDAAVDEAKCKSQANYIWKALYDRLNDTTYYSCVFTGSKNVERIQCAVTNTTTQESGTITYTYNCADAVKECTTDYEGTVISNSSGTENRTISCQL